MGQFSDDEVQDLIDVLDNRVPNQTVPGRMDPPTLPDHQMLPEGLLVTGAIVVWCLLYGDLALF
jgi:hypothetical protein